MPTNAISTPTGSFSTENLAAHMGPFLDTLMIGNLGPGWFLADAFANEFSRQRSEQFFDGDFIVFHERAAFEPPSFTRDEFIAIVVECARFVRKEVAGFGDKVSHMNGTESALRRFFGALGVNVPDRDFSATEYAAWIEGIPKEWKSRGGYEEELTRRL